MTSAPWRSRIVRHADVAPSELAAHPLNFRRHPQSQADALAAAIDTVGVVQSVIVSERSGRILDGHLRAELALARGEPSLPAAFVDVDEDEERLVLATFDPIGALAETDSASLSALLDSLAPTADGLADLLASLRPEIPVAPREDPGAQLDRAEGLREKWCTERGQLWEVGRHRLLCGDSTSAEDVARLMRHESARLCVTSPPYNQQIDSFHPSGMHKETDWVSKIERLTYPDSLPESEYQDQQRHALRVWYAVLSDGGSLFYNHKNRYRAKEVVSPLKWLPGPFRWRQEIVWSRPGSVTQNARMFLPSDERIYWLYKGDDFWFDDTTEHKTWSTVWEIATLTQKHHAAPFPIEVPLRCIRACSARDDIVLDPYVGSGTTLVAAEQTGRIGYGLEIEPKYIAVVLERLASMGLTPRMAD